VKSQNLFVINRTLITQIVEWDRLVNAMDELLAVTRNTAIPFAQFAGQTRTTVVLVTGIVMSAETVIHRRDCELLETPVQPALLSGESTAWTLWPSEVCPKPVHRWFISTYATLAGAAIDAS
jgi:hypothetical protein